MKNKCPPVVQCLEDLKQWHLTVVAVNTGHKTKTFTLPDTSTNTLIKACLTSFLRYNLQFVHHKNNMETLDSYILRPYILHSYILRSYISSCCCCLFSRSKLLFMCNVNDREMNVALKSSMITRDQPVLSFMSIRGGRDFSSSKACKKFWAEDNSNTTECEYKCQ